MQRIILFLLLLCPLSLLAEIPSDCEERREKNGWPSYYCECNYNYHDFSLPIDMQVSDTVWFRAYLSDIIRGMSAYLHADCDFQFNIYTRCSVHEPNHTAIFSQNKTSTLDADFITQKLIEMGYDPDGVNARFYLSISPINGMGGRIICHPTDKGIHSTCSDALHLFPDMNILSSNADDVYIIDPSDIPAGEDVCVRWQSATNTPCHLRVTRGTCDGKTIAEMDFRSQEDLYRLSSWLLDDAWNSEEVFYLHFSHDAKTSGTISLYSELVEYVDIITDTAVCRTQGLQLPDTLLTESTVYPYDTIQYAAGVYHILKYRVTILESKSHYETVEACESYTWNGETYTKSGDYVYTTTATNGCDSIVTLHLTINQSVATEETAFACDSYEWNGATYTTSGDYTYTTATANGCDSVVSLHLTIYQSETAEETVVACDSYEWNGTTYTESGDYTYFSAADNGCDRIVTLRLTIHQSETVEETVVACDSYSWNGATYTESGDYTYITTTDNGCDRVEILHLTIDICSAVEDVPATSEEIRKILQGDQILILRNGQTYNLLGRMIN